MAVSSSPANFHIDTKEEHDKKFYAEGRPEIPELMSDILINYSGIPKDELISHVEGLV